MVIVSIFKYVQYVDPARLGRIVVILASPKVSKGKQVVDSP